MDDRKKSKDLIGRLLPVLIAVLVGVALFSGWQIIRTVHRDRSAARDYGSISRDAVTVKPAAAVRTDQAVGTAPLGVEPGDDASGAKADTAADEVSPVDVDFVALKDVSTDIIGWIYSDNGVINYPVVRAEDDTYYLSHLADGTQNNNGAIFLQPGCDDDFSGRNSIIHGHHMNSGKMFGTLTDYYKQEYYDKYPVMYLSIPGHNYKVELFAGFDTEPDSFVYDFWFDNDRQFDTWLTKAKSSSCFSSDVDVDIDDHILTMSTCSYTFYNARFVLLGKLTEIG